MNSFVHIKVFVLLLVLALTACTAGEREGSKTASDILGDPEYMAISFGSFRATTRDTVPGVDQIKEDLHLLSAMGVRVLRTYNTQIFEEVPRLLQAIRDLKEADPAFEMYVMLGAWIDCKGAWGESPDHNSGDLERNTAEINAAIALAKQYPDIVKVIAVGNEAMVHWASSYFVEPGVILKWVRHLQELKAAGELDRELWITSSDNFASWGGGDASYHKEDLVELIRAVDYISLHTYPFHDSHYDPAYWGVQAGEEELSLTEKTALSMQRAAARARMQYRQVRDFLDSLGIEKEIHIGESGWASRDNYLYGAAGSRAADEYKQKLYYDLIREWTQRDSISCFYFEAFDEPWKDHLNPGGSENHFGLFTVDGRAKYVLWELVDRGLFEGLTRDGNPVSKTYEGDEEALLADLTEPPANLIPMNQ